MYVDPSYIAKYDDNGHIIPHFMFWYAGMVCRCQVESIQEYLVMTCDRQCIFIFVNLGIGLQRLYDNCMPYVQWIFHVINTSMLYFSHY